MGKYRPFWANLGRFMGYLGPNGQIEGDLGPIHAYTCIYRCFARAAADLSFWGLGIISLT